MFDVGKFGQVIPMKKIFKRFGIHFSIWMPNQTKSNNEIRFVVKPIL